MEESKERVSIPYQSSEYDVTASNRLNQARQADAGARNFATNNTDNSNMFQVGFAQKSSNPLERE